MQYSIDTSALMDAWSRWYPPDLFPSLWGRLEQSTDDQQIVASEEVRNELERKDDDLFAWVSSRPKMFLELDDYTQVAASEILGEFPKMVDERTGKSMADPFVIAVARVHDLAVVTGEKGGTVQRPKIPNVCDHYGLRCIDIVSLIRELQFQF